MYLTDDMIENLIDQSFPQSDNENSVLGKYQITTSICDKTCTLTESFKEYYETYNKPLNNYALLQLGVTSKHSCSSQRRHIRRLIIRKVFFLWWWYLICYLVYMFKNGTELFNNSENKKERRKTFLEAFLLMFSSYMALFFFETSENGISLFSGLTEYLAAVLVICTGIFFVFFFVRFVLRHYTQNHATNSFSFIDYSIDKLETLVCQYYKSSHANTYNQVHKYYHPEKFSIISYEKRPR